MVTNNIALEGLEFVLGQCHCSSSLDFGRVDDPLDRTDSSKDVDFVQYLDGDRSIKFFEKQGHCCERQRKNDTHNVFVENHQNKNDNNLMAYYFKNLKLSLT